MRKQEGMPSDTFVMSKGHGVMAQYVVLEDLGVLSTQDLEAYVKSGWIDGLIDSSIETTSIGGMPAVLATARAGEWNFRLAAIRFEDDEVYRLIFAAHGLDAATEKLFRASIESFRRLAADEASRVKPLRIGLVTAKPEDTPAQVSARMVVPDKPLETFALLNGLEEGATLKPGERYKLVLE